MSQTEYTDALDAAEQDLDRLEHEAMDQHAKIVLLRAYIKVIEQLGESLIRVELPPVHNSMQVIMNRLKTL